MSVAIRLENVSVRFGDTQALGGVSFALAPGELLVLVGPSGCGKSTLLRSIAGFVTPDSGRVLFDGEDVTQLAPHDRRVGMVFQSFALFPHMNVTENVAFGLREQGTQKPEISSRVEQALAEVRLTGFGGRSVDQLSGGEQQRVALARALITRPRCLLLDEPLSNLDAGLRHHMRDEIRRVCKLHGLSTLYVTHDQKEALAIADRVLVMRKGTAEQLGTPWEVYRTPASRSVATFLGETNLLSGRVSARSEHGLRVSAGALDFSATPRGDFEVGANVLLSIRPECIQLQEAGAEGSFQVTVACSTYLGELSAYDLLHGGLRLRSYELNPRLPARPEGSVLWARVEPEDVVVLEPDASS
jgi:iron(III) transport system ATP-binding protein